MIKCLKVSGKAFLAACLFHPQLSMAEEFTSADVLAWEESAQNSLFLTSIGMIGIVATQTKRHDQIVSCINEWYWNDGEVDNQKNDDIRAAMQRFPDYHPQGIILAVVEKACGNFSLD